MLREQIHVSYIFLYTYMLLLFESYFVLSVWKHAEIVHGDNSSLFTLYLKTPEHDQVKLQYTKENILHKFVTIISFLYIYKNMFAYTYVK